MYSTWRSARHMMGSVRSIIFTILFIDSHCEIPRNLKLLNKFNDVSLENLKNKLFGFKSKVIT